MSVRAAAVAAQPVIREAGDRDLPALAALAEAVFHAHYVPMLGRGQVEWMLPRMYSVEALRRQRQLGHVFHIALVARQPVGFAAFSMSSEDTAEGSIHKLYLLPAHQRRGLGRLMVERMCARLAGLDRRRVSLSVNRRNFQAINFYFKMGFTIRSVVDTDIGGGFQMNDFVMVKRLTLDSASARMPVVLPPQR